MIFLLMINILFWIVYYIVVKSLRGIIKSRLMSDPAYAERFENDTMTRSEDYQFILLGFIILTGRFVVVADLFILMGIFFVFGPH